MAVKIRLARFGKKNAPFYRIVVADARSPRDGRFIEQIGYYDPKKDPPRVKVDLEKFEEWIKKGAQPTEIVRKLVNRVKTHGQNP